MNKIPPPLSNGILLFIGIIVLLILFAISYCVRKPYLNQTLGGPHEWVTAHALISIENLNQYSVPQHLFRIVTTYPSGVNFHITDWLITRIMSSDGIGFYTTYPPFSVILPFLFFKLLQIDVSIGSIQYFNMGLHFLTTICLFMMIYHTVSRLKLVASLLSATVYIFAAPNLWFYSATYSWDILWYYLLIVCLLILSVIFSDTISNITLKCLLVLLGIVNALMVYTEFQGIFFVLSAIIVSFAFNNPHKLKIAKYLIFSTLTAVVTNVVQNSLISGFDDYIKVMAYKVFDQYSTFNSHALSKFDYSFTWSRYSNLLTPSIILTLTIFIIVKLFKPRQALFERHQMMIILVPVIVALLHTIFLFPDVVIHEFASLQVVIILCLIIGITVSKMQLPHLPAYTMFSIFLCCALGYYAKHSISTFIADAGEKPNTYFIDFAMEVNKHLHPDEVLFFVTDGLIPPQITYFTKRNFAIVRNYEEARNILLNTKNQKGKIFWINEYGNIEDITTVDSGPTGNSCLPAGREPGSHQPARHACGPWGNKSLLAISE